jgi:hypothetical protein
MTHYNDATEGYRPDYRRKLSEMTPKSPAPTDRPYSYADKPFSPFHWQALQPLANVYREEPLHGLFYLMDQRPGDRRPTTSFFHSYTIIYFFVFLLLFLFFFTT